MLLIFWYHRIPKALQFSKLKLHPNFPEQMWCWLSAPLFCLQFSASLEPFRRAKHQTNIPFLRFRALNWMPAHFLMNSKFLAHSNPAENAINWKPNTCLCLSICFSIYLSISHFALVVFFLSKLSWELFSLYRIQKLCCGWGKLDWESWEMGKWVDVNLGLLI